MSNQYYYLTPKDIVREGDEVEYWLSYVHGGDNISKRKKLKGGKVALRSDYMCW